MKAGPLPPPPLTEGSLVGVAAPSGPFDRERFEKGLARLHGLGFKTRIPSQIYDRQGFLAGPDRLRAATLSGLLADPEIDAVMAARGGYGVMRILDRLDLEPLAARPRIVLGFSDITALLMGLHQRLGLVCFHGPVITSLGEADERSLRHLHDLLTGRIVFPLEIDPAGAIAPGRAEGPLLGGNLTLLVHLLPTPWMPDLDGAILFLEDIDESPYRLDRMLTTLRLSGRLDRCRGILLGSFTNCGRPEEVREVLTSALADFPGPVLAGGPFGHESTNLTLPIGPRAALDADAGRLDVLDPYLA